MEPLKPGDPERVGRYRLLRRLGEGGMGVVYLACSWTGRKVAVKVIHEHLLPDVDARARFAREIKAASTVSGPFTASVLQADSAGDPPWLATGYLPGVSLQEAVEAAEDGLPPETVRALAMGIIEAIATIHRYGVVHRDLTPRNVMLTTVGPRVIDFGISRVTGHQPITRPDRTVGTRGYMSPEHQGGATARPADDVFSLGAILAFAATGRPPPATGATETAWRLDALGDPELSAVVRSCLDPVPDDRPGTDRLLLRLGPAAVSLHGADWLPDAVAALIDFRHRESREMVNTPLRQGTSPTPSDAEATVDTADTSAQADATAPDRLPGLPPKYNGLSRRRLMVTASVLTAAVGTGSLLWLNRSATSQPTSGEPSPSPSPSAPPPAAAKRWQTRVGNSFPDLTVAAGMLLAQTPDQLIGLDPGSGEIAWKHKAHSTDVSGDHGFFMNNSDYPQVMNAVDAETGDVAWSHNPDSLIWFTYTAGSQTYVVTEGIEALGAKDGQHRWSADVKANKDFGLSLDGDADLLVVQGAKLVALDPADGSTAWTYFKSDGPYPLVGWELGGGLVFGLDDEFKLYAIRAEDGDLAWDKKMRPVRHTPQYRGDRLYLSTMDGDVMALTATTGEQVWNRKLGNGEGRSYGYSNTIQVHGDTLYVGATDHRVYALDAADGRILWTHDVEVTPGTPPVVVGDLVFVGLADGGIRALERPGEV